MAKRIIKEGILVVRDGKRIRPTIGKSFDLTADEIKQLEAIRPNAIAKVGAVEEDPASIPVAADENDAATGDTDAAETSKRTSGRGRGRAAKPDDDSGDL